MLIMALVVLQRLGELMLAKRNTQSAQGARRGGNRRRAIIRLIVLLHTAWLLAVLWLLPAPLRDLLGAGWPCLSCCRRLRVWVIASLGPYWTTRIISLPGAPLVKRGPYRFVRHPNYLVVAGEIVVLPLVFGEIAVAIIFTSPMRRCCPGASARKRPAWSRGGIRAEGSEACCAIADRFCSCFPSRFFITRSVPPRRCSASRCCCWP